MVIGLDGEPKMKTPNPRIEFLTHTSYHGTSCIARL